MRELILPVEGFVAGDGGVADERVAALDVFAEGVQFPMLLGCPKPQGKLRYLYALFVDIDSIEVVLQYLVVDLVSGQLVARYPLHHLEDLLMLALQELEGGIEEST